MTKYQPLTRFLSQRTDGELPMTFRNLESILGFSLPGSARNHQAWWSNNESHVNAAAWRKAGWKTSRVDLSGERVTFVRERTLPVATASMDEGQDAPGRETKLFDRLSAGGRRLVADWAEAHAVSQDEAIAAIVGAAAKARQHQLVEDLPFAIMPAGYDSVAMIREDRDGR